MKDTSLGRQQQAVAEGEIRAVPSDFCPHCAETEPVGRSERDPLIL